MHQIGLAFNCKLENKDRLLATFHHNLSVGHAHPAADKTMGDLFERMCDRAGLLAIDAGDHYHVQPKGH